MPQRELCPLHGDLYDCDRCAVCERILAAINTSHRLAVSSSAWMDELEAALTEARSAQNELHHGDATLAQLKMGIVEARIKRVLVLWRGHSSIGVFSDCGEKAQPKE